MSWSTHYDVLGVVPGSTVDQIRVAYRQRARELHPDVSRISDDGQSMARVNEAWRVLSDPESRRDYDQRALGGLVLPLSPQPPPQASQSRRTAWVAGLQSQIGRLSRLAGRSATQALLVRSNRSPREVYEHAVDQIVRALLVDTEARVRAARAAGAAPLDLGVAATLIGLRTLGDSLRRESSLGITSELEMKAELVDRMWDILAHELTKQLTVALGGNPHVAHALARR